MGQADGDSGLLFAGGSHRDFALPFWRDPAAEALDSRGYRMASPGRMALGDVSWHAGVTLSQPFPGLAKQMTLCDVSRFDPLSR